jgi:dienelactone hydrolase
VVSADERRAFEKEMTEAGIDWRLIVYGRTGHSFTNPEADGWGLPGFTYQPDSDRRSWSAMRDLLGETLAIA